MSVSRSSGVLCRVIQVASRYTSFVASCSSEHVWKKLLSVEERPSTDKKRSLRLKWSIADGGVIACCGTCKCVVGGSDTLGLAVLAHKITAETEGQETTKNSKQGSKDW